MLPTAAVQGNAYPRDRIAELDRLIAEMEADLKKQKDKELRAWLSGALYGLRVARSAWGWLLGGTRDVG